MIIFTVYDDFSYVEEARRLGADGYVLKREPSSTLVEAVRTAAQGETYFSDELSSDPSSKLPGTPPQHEALTEREREVLQLTAEAYTNQEIANRLEISRRTAEKHREHIRTKLGAKNVVEMATYVYRRGLLPGQSKPDVSLKVNEW